MKISLYDTLEKRLLMSTNPRELQIALRNLHILEEALEALRGQISVANPALLAAVAPTYLRRIEALEAEIAAYISMNPTDIAHSAAAIP